MIEYDDYEHRGKGFTDIRRAIYNNTRKKLSEIC